MAEAICLGELLIDFVPTVTGTSLIDAPAFQKAPGGAPANVAVGLSRLGVSSAFMGKVGDDPFGHFLATTLEQAGVDIGPLRYSAAARTALAFVSLRADGEREFMFYRHPSADMLFQADEVDEAAIAQARLLHFGSITLIGEPVRSATLHAIEVARRNGCLISCDPNLRLDLWPDANAAHDGLILALSQAQIVKISDDEVNFLVGSEDPALVRKRLWHDDLQLMVMTSGRKGSRYLTAELEGHVPGFVVEAIDATGAGDAFTAGMLRCVLQDPKLLESDERLREACRFANAAGALTTTMRGGIPAQPPLARVLEFLQTAG